MRLDVFTVQTHYEELLDLTPLSPTEEKRFCRAKLFSQLEHAVKLAQSKLHHEDLISDKVKRAMPWKNQLQGKSADFMIIDDVVNYPLTYSE